MSAGDLFGAKAREILGACVEEIETESEAEVVLAVRPRVQSLDVWAWAAGALCGYILLLFFLYGPPAFEFWVASVGVPLAFLLGWSCVRSIDALRRLVPTRIRQEHTHQAAQAAFTALGVANTTSRVGILVYVAVAERQVIVIPDRGLTKVWSIEAVAKASSNLEMSLHSSVGIEPLKAGLDSLGLALADALPNSGAPLNELENVQ